MSEDWFPTLPESTAPIYLRIVSAIVDDLAKQRLRPGMRMPTHRDLAERLNVNVGTITRAYSKAKEMGLLSGEIGRGTFISAVAPAHETSAATTAVIDLMLNKPVMLEEGAFLRRSFQQLADSYSVEGFLQYPVATGSERHRLAGARLAAMTGLDVDADQIAITNGAQQALMASVSIFAGPGATVATENLNYAGIRAITDLLRIRVAPIQMDDEGLVPDSLEQVCRSERIAALVVTPSIHNPTTATMSLERRQAVAAIAGRYGVPIVENDVYGALIEQPLQPIYTLAETPCCYICGISKTVASGVRVGYVVTAPELVPQVMAAIHATTWTVAPLQAELASQWMFDGTVQRLIEGHRAEIRRRQLLAREVLADWSFRAHPQSYHLWLPLPERWRLHEFIDACMQTGVMVTSGAVFATGAGYAPNAVRVALGAQQDIEMLRAGLARLAQALRSRPAFGTLMI